MSAAATTHDFQIVAVDTETPADAGFTVKLDKPFGDYQHGQSDDVLPQSEAVSHAVEDAYARGLDATQYSEREQVGTLVVDESGAYVCVQFRK